MSDGRPFDALPGTTYNGFAAGTPDPVPAAPRRRGRRAGAWLAGVALAAALAGGVVAGLTVHLPGARPQAPVAAVPAPPPPQRGPATLPQPSPAAASPPTAPPDIVATAPPAPAVRSRHAAPPSPAAASVKPAFHCDWRLRPSEKMICADATLAALDRRLNQAFAAAIRAGVPREPLRRAQDRWVFQREVVARRSHAALVRYYQQRITELDLLASEPS